MTNLLSERIGDDSREGFSSGAGQRSMSTLKIKKSSLLSVDQLQLISYQMVRILPFGKYLPIEMYRVSFV